MRIQSRLHHTPADMVGKARPQQGKPVSRTDMQSLHPCFYCGTKLHISHSLNVKTVFFPAKVSKIYEIMLILHELNQADDKQKYI